MDRINASNATLLFALSLGMGACATQEPGETGSADPSSSSSDAQTTDPVASTSDPATTSGEPGTTTTSPGTTSAESSTGVGTDSSGDPIIFDVNGEVDVPGGEICGSEPTLAVTFRDFASTHPDFEAFWGVDASLGLVLPELGDDGTPDYNPSPPPSPPDSAPTQITSAATFANWYHDTMDINVAVEQEIALVETPPGSGLFVFDDSTFFPVDGQGWNAAPGPNNEQFPDTLGDLHNFHFTTEIHTSFVYEAGQVFTFVGDDDLWVFVDGMLEMDLGGLHGQLTDSIDLDTLGLTPGETYDMDIFHAERRHNGSTFRVETSINCFLPPAG